MNDSQRDGRATTWQHAPDAPSTAAFTQAERDALSALRSRYFESHDLLSGRELERLRFLRWLYETGRIES